MSYLAVGAVTKSLVELLGKKLNKPSLLAVTPRVTTLPPDDDRVGADTGVNLFLYRITESAFHKNMPWRGDRSNPQGSTRPPLALTLNYLLTGYAKRVASATDEDVTVHQILGNAMAILHDYPILNDIHDGDFDADTDTQFAKELRESFDKVKVTLLPITLEDSSKIWTGFSKPYRLSVAYEVSLVQIAPLAPSKLPPPPPSHAAVTADTLGAPSILEIEPKTGSPGVTITLSGVNFGGPGDEVSVTVGGVTLFGGDLPLLTESRIQFALPANLFGGPHIAITVSRSGVKSTPASFLVAPWISTLQPVRGITGVPVKIPIPVPVGATVTATVGGVAATATLNARRDAVTVLVPTTITKNGPAPVVLTVNDGVAKSSNALTYEVVPQIASFIIAVTGTPAKTKVTVTGERLRGSSVELRYAKLRGQVGDVSDTTAFAAADTTISFEFPGALAAGGPVSLMVDGRATNELPRRVTSVHPASAVSGTSVTLFGVGLAGRSVVVSFGGLVLAAVPQPFATRSSLNVPAGMAAGSQPIKVVVDGDDAGTVPFEVLP